MADQRTILCIVGTRPEAIKMAPVILALQRRPWADVKVLATAQHREMLDQVLRLFAIRPDEDLDIMRRDQDLPDLTARLLTALDGALGRFGPDLVLAQGDTTTVLAAALAAFYRRIPFGHVEAGLRTGDTRFPFPEEMNRTVADRLCAIRFAPTDRARRHLLEEGIPEASIHVTGNTVIDALLDAAKKEVPLEAPLDPDKAMILITAHRREHFGAPFLEICGALREIAALNPGLQLLYPVHPNPNIHDVAHRELGGHAGIVLAEPMDYGPFVTAMKRCRFILTDSGGIQEEAPALGKPVLVLRDGTERPEALEAGVVRLVGTKKEAIVAAARELLEDESAYRAMARGCSPYGDGRAAERIADLLERHLEIRKVP